MQPINEGASPFPSPQKNNHVISPFPSPQKPSPAASPRKRTHVATRLPFHLHNEENNPTPLDQERMKLARREKEIGKRELPALEPLIEAVQLFDGKSENSDLILQRCPPQLRTQFSWKLLQALHGIFNDENDSWGNIFRNSNPKVLEDLAYLLWKSPEFAFELTPVVKECLALLDGRKPHIFTAYFLARGLSFHSGDLPEEYPLIDRLTHLDCPIGLRSILNPSVRQKLVKSALRLKEAGASPPSFRYTVAMLEYVKIGDNLRAKNLDDFVYWLIQPFASKQLKFLITSFNDFKLKQMPQVEALFLEEIGSLDVFDKMPIETICHNFRKLILKKVFTLGTTWCGTRNWSHHLQELVLPLIWHVREGILTVAEQDLLKKWLARVSFTRLKFLVEHCAPLPCFPHLIDALAPEKQVLTPESSVMKFLKLGCFFHPDLRASDRLIAPDPLVIEESAPGEQWMYAQLFPHQVARPLIQVNDVLSRFFPEPFGNSDASESDEEMEEADKDPNFGMWILYQSRKNAQVLTDLRACVLFWMDQLLNTKVDSTLPSSFCLQSFAVLFEMVKGMNPLSPAFIKSFQALVEKSFNDELNRMQQKLSSYQLILQWGEIADKFPELFVGLHLNLAPLIGNALALKLSPEEQAQFWGALLRLQRAEPALIDWRENREMLHNPKHRLRNRMMLQAFHEKASVNMARLLAQREQKGKS